ncbi:MAG: aspartate kinase, partial [Bacteroidales bacterium]|nr:aspartate kinase [Bacteroidales bacterium]
MKIMKFGGTSVGTPERMKSVVNLINSGEKVIVVLSAMSGTTNALIEISGMLISGNNAAALNKIETLRARYHDVIKELYSTQEYKDEALKMADEHFNYIAGFVNGTFSRSMEKSIIAEGELLSTNLFSLLLQEMKIRSELIPALNFMRIDKYGEPDIYYITENLNRELAGYPDTDIFVTQG